MPNSYKVHRITIAAIIFAFGTTVAASEKPQAEILHWWSSPAEAAALNVFVDEFKARGGHYYDSTKNNQIASREEAIARLSKGYPSTLTQWNAGRDVREFFEYGLTSSINDPKLVSKLKKSLPKAVLDAVTHNDKIIAMPLNIHSENWMWYSNELIDYHDSVISNQWQEFIKQGEELAKKNIPLLAVGDQSWQVRILFTSLFLGISRDAYKDFYLNIDPEVTKTVDFNRVLEVFTTLAKYSKSFGDGNWNTQVKAVAENQAGATFMGDWAKGEFHVLGKTAGSEFGCALTSGIDPSLLLVIDTFILGKVTDPAEQTGQSLMLDIVSDPEVNRQFNTLKGSVSPYIRPSADELDPCSVQVYEALPRDNSVIPPYASYQHGAHLHSIDNEIYQLWTAARESNDTDALIASSTTAFRKFLTSSAKENSQALASSEE